MLNFVNMTSEKKVVLLTTRKNSVQDLSMNFVQYNSKMKAV